MQLDYILKRKCAKMDHLKSLPHGSLELAFSGLVYRGLLGARPAKWS